MAITRMASVREQCDAGGDGAVTDVARRLVGTSLLKEKRECMFNTLAEREGEEERERERDEERRHMD
jgi:hypothetical protein